jgi:murein DD-endopeptidase MepM/ murein hydrolase activator NlpD
VGPAFVFNERDHSACAVQVGHRPARAAAGAGRGSPPSLSGLLRTRLAAWRARVEARCDALDLAPDLAEEIGSRRWFRGLGTMLGLGLAAIAFWPDFSAVEAATTMRIDDATRDEFRSQMIMPLALGGDSGRRMGATSAVVPLARAPERPTVSLTATLGQGDSFGRMLQRAGVGVGDAAQISALVAGTLPLDDIAPGTQVDLTLGRRPAPGSPRPLDALAFRARFDLDLAIERRGGRLALEQRPIAVDATPLRITGTVGSSLYRSARAAGAPVKAIQQYLQVLDRHLGVDGDIAPSDHFDIIVGYRRSARGERAVGDLLYAGLEREGRPRAQLLRWGKDGQFFEASGVGRQTAAAQFAPVAGRITSPFGMRRHPILGYTRMHGGVDFGARWGSPIHAASAGVVSFAGRHGGHGNYVRLDHGGGLGTGYAHMSRIAVSPGMHVQAGQVIGYVGSTGLSTGPHLHFEAYRNGQRINPLSLRFTARAAVDKQELSAFKARLAELKAVESGAALVSLAPKQAAVKKPPREIGRLGQ